jgi:hypothetical protein
MIKMNNKWKTKYHTVSTGPTSSRKIVETDEKSTPLTHNMTAQFPGLLK